MDGVVIKPGGVGGDNDVMGLLCYIVLCLLHLLLLLWGKLDQNIRGKYLLIPKPWFPNNMSSLMEFFSLILTISAVLFFLCKVSELAQ
jgi:hypothetical protein